MALSDEEKLELVRTAIDAFNRRDTEAMVALGVENFEYDWSRSMGPNAGVYRGVDGFFEFIDEQWDTFEEVRLEAREMVVSGEHVVVTAVTHGRGREGIEVTARSAQLFTFENDRMVRLTLYQDTAEALAAARE
jgi:ketosteroid isomerase-like protein